MRQTTRYPASVKESLLAKALGSNSPSMVDLGKEFNIPYTTVYQWIKMNKQNVKQINLPQRPQDKSARERLQAVLDTINKPEAERSAYCRQHGIYANHLDEWEKQALENLSVANTKQHKAENLQIKNENKQLKQNLNRKDKALAEVSALLILKKKADLLWGDNEDA